MSHAATNWALSVGRGRGLSGAEKWVLWYLCDCYNPDMGCFPRQETIAEHCEISIASVNRHLAKLEDCGLIERNARRDEATGRQLRTRYKLAFEPDFKGEQLPLISLRDGKRAPTRSVRDGAPQVFDLQDETDSHNERRPDSQVDRKPSLILRALDNSCNSNPVRSGKPRSILEILKEEFPAQALAVKALDAQETPAGIRVIHPNEFQLAALDSAGLLERVKALIAETGEARPVSVAVGSNSAPAELPNDDKIRTVA